MTRDSRSKPLAAETVQQGSVHETDGAGTAIAHNPVNTPGGNNG